MERKDRQADRKLNRNEWQNVKNKKVFMCRLRHNKKLFNRKLYDIYVSVLSSLLSLQVTVFLWN